MNKTAQYIISALLIILLWWLISIIINSPILPLPFKVFKQIVKLKFELYDHIIASFRRIIIGLGGALVIAVPSGLVIGRLKWLDRYLSPFIYFAYPVPKIAFLPVVLLFLGLGDLSKVFLIGLIVFFQILVHTRDASKSISQELILSVKSLGATKIELFWHVILPASLPRIFTSIRISLGTAIAVLFFTETFATFKGLGFFIMDAWTRVNYSEMFAGILTLSFLGFILFLFVDFIEKIICPWLFLDELENNN